jgi:hypothetical protein
MYLSDVIFPQRAVPLVGEEPGLDARNVRGQPLAVADRHRLVQAAVQQEHGNLDLAHVEPPRDNLGQVVIQNPVDTGCVGLLHADRLVQQERRIIGRARLPHSRGQLGGRFRQHLRPFPLGHGAGRGPVREHQGHPVGGVWPHPGEPVQAFCVIRGGRGQGRGRGHQVG